MTVKETSATGTRPTVGDYVSKGFFSFVQERIPSGVSGSIKQLSSTFQDWKQDSNFGRQRAVTPCTRKTVGAHEWGLSKPSDGRSVLRRFRATPQKKVFSREGRSRVESIAIMTRRREKAREILLRPIELSSAIGNRSNSLQKDYA